MIIESNLRILQQIIRIYIFFIFYYLSHPSIIFEKIADEAVSGYKICVQTELFILRKIVS